MCSLWKSNNSCALWSKSSENLSVLPFTFTGGFKKVLKTSSSTKVSKEMNVSIFVFVWIFFLKALNIQQYYQFDCIAATGYEQNLNWWWHLSSVELLCSWNNISKLMNFAISKLSSNQTKSKQNWLKLNNDSVAFCRAAYGWTELV